MDEMSLSHEKHSMSWFSMAKELGLCRLELVIGGLVSLTSCRELRLESCYSK